VDVLEQFLLVAPVLLFSMVAHEYAHGYAALKQGDNTAEQLGRLTWNPVKHIDPFMTVLLPAMMFILSNGAFLFGGARPVPVNPRNYRNYKRGDIIVSLAGIVTNLGIAVALTVIIPIIGMIGHAAPAAIATLGILQVMFIYAIQLNLVLAVFNLLPIPPLDGSHVMKYLLPPRWSISYQRLGGYGFIILMVLMTFGRPLLMAWMAPVTTLRLWSMRAINPYLLPNPWS
jgi:Zn-dependent protease